MDPNTRQQLFNWHYKHDPLFRKLAEETEIEKDPARFEHNIALMALALEGRVRISQDTFGVLLFDSQVAN